MPLEEPFRQDRVGEPSDRPTGRTEERELYACLYERLYPALQSADYAELARLSGLKERRIREVLQYRLSGEIPQLFGVRKGTCYVCREGLSGTETTEPACLDCLGKIDRAMEQSGLYQGLSGEEPRPEMATEEPTMEMVPRAEYDKVLKELEFYRQQLAEPAFQPMSADEGPTREMAMMPEGRAEFLAILDLPDAEVEEDAFPMSAQPADELRHYGFKKIRGR